MVTCLVTLTDIETRRSVRQRLSVPVFLLPLWDRGN